MAHEQLGDRCRGVLLGLAAGDHNGGPIRMALRLAESLDARGRFDPEDILRRYVRWWREGAFDTGPVAERVLASVAAGSPPSEATARVHEELGGKTAGCNPAHRGPPLAMAAFLPDDALAACAAHEAALTHHDPLAGDVAAAGVVLCRQLLRGLPWPEALARAAGGRWPETRRALNAGAGPPARRGGYAPDVLHAAVFFVGEAASFGEALDRALAFAGPANYCPVLAGALAGARWGAAAIPPGQRDHRNSHGIADRVARVADGLAERWTGGGRR